VFTRQASAAGHLATARRRSARLSPTAAREWGIAVTGYLMRILENPTEHIEDNLGELDTALAALQAIRDRIAST
jgi:hypothetical protein